MVVSISAGLLSSAPPAPVQIVVTGVPVGAEYVVRGSALGSSWVVPGGVGVGDGGQVVLTDNRGAINAAITYSVLVEGATTTAAPITVALPGVRAVLQSLDGRVAVQGGWLPNGLPLEPESRYHVVDVPGRDRPPLRIATGGDGGLSLLIRTGREDSGRLAALLRAGAPVVLRTDGTLLDLPAVELVLITRAPSRAAWDVVGLPADRVWSLDLLLVDDPEPSSPLSTFTWDDFDAAMVGFVWSPASSFPETGVAGWVASGSHTLAMVSGQARATSAASGAVDVTRTQAETVTPGQSWTITASVRGTAGRTARVALVWSTGAVSTGTAVTLTSSWQTVTLTGTAPAGASMVRPRVSMVSATAAAQYVELADVTLNPGTTVLPTFDGLFAGRTWDDFDAMDWGELL